MFLDVKKTFDKVLDRGLIYKPKEMLPYPYYLLKSYLDDRTCQVLMFKTNIGALFIIHS